MKVKLVNPGHAASLLDPDTQRAPFIDPTTKGAIEVAEVPETSFWVRRLRAGEIERVADAPAVLAPVTPLTTR